MADTLFGEDLHVAETFSESERFVAVCDDALACARSLPSGFFSLVITSPPYNIGKEYERRSSLRDYLAEQRPLITELVRVLKHTGSLCWQVGKAEGRSLPSGKPPREESLGSEPHRGEKIDGR